MGNEVIATADYKHYKVRRSEKVGRRDIWSTDGRNQEKGKKRDSTEGTQREKKRYRKIRGTEGKKEMEEEGNMEVRGNRSRKKA